MALAGIDGARIAAHWAAGKCGRGGSSDDVYEEGSARELVVVGVAHGVGEQGPS